ncbi:MAG: L-lactate dehydrogenase complex protein LldF [Clostridia bacterium]|nr:L-lactate dehydrogenase complex protein LldF [Clostridia bacterium]
MAKNQVAVLEPLRERVAQMQKRYPEVSRRALEVKSYSIANLDDLLAQAQESLKVKGYQVHLAKDAQDALAYIASVIGDRLVVASESATLEEIDLIPSLKQKGIKVIETEMDGFARALKGKERDPGMGYGALWTRLARGDLKALYQEIGRPVPEGEIDAQEISEVIRLWTRKYIAEAPVGITGTGAVVTETGTVVFQENEGNVRMVSNLPPVHIVVAGLDKLVPTLEDAFAVLRAAAVYGYGQPIGNYVSLITGPSRTGDIEFIIVNGMHGPLEVHLVLLDNGRTQALRDGLEEVLYCVGCRACLNNCPIYAKDGSFPGAVKLILKAEAGGLNDKEASYLETCAKCDICKKACPVQIDPPKLIGRMQAKGKTAS